MPTFTDIYTDALQKIHAYAPGEPIDDSDAETCLRVGNDMLDSWSNESLSCYAILEQSVLLNPPVAQYSIGPGGMINGTRPLKLIDGPGSAYLLDTNNNRYGVDVLPQDKWNMVTSNTQISANVPIYIFYDPQYPLGLINVWPIPNIAWTLYFDSYLQLVDFTNINGPINFPPGYKKAIQDCLAVEIWPYFFRNKPIDPLIVEIASKSKGNIKRTNIRENIAIYDAALVVSGTPTYNIFTDDRGG
jgi:hypothetical protein